MGGGEFYFIAVILLIAHCADLFGKSKVMHSIVAMRKPASERKPHNQAND